VARATPQLGMLPRGAHKPTEAGPQDAQQPLAAMRPAGAAGCEARPRTDGWHNCLHSISPVKVVRATAIASLRPTMRSCAWWRCAVRNRCRRRECVPGFAGIPAGCRCGSLWCVQHRHGQAGSGSEMAGVGFGVDDGNRMIKAAPTARHEVLRTAEVVPIATTLRVTRRLSARRAGPVHCDRSLQNAAILAG
jgi:hypothetical protein